MTAKQQYFKTAAETCQKKLEKRGFAAKYFPSSDEAKKYVLSLIPDGATVSWGGAMTLEETGIKDALRKGNYTCLDRENADGAEEIKQIYRDSFSADYYLMSTNAITKDGKLVNIDGRGNRLAALIYGPENVIIVAGMNKLVTDEQAAIDRVKNFASPMNVKRLEKNTPCSKNGLCSNCLSADCICSHTVVTRRDPMNGRIKVLLIGEELGY